APPRAVSGASPKTFVPSGVAGLEAEIDTHVFRLYGLDPGGNRPHPRQRRMSTRVQNEAKFGAWEDLPGGGRRYRLDVVGRQGWSACYFKEVDVSEATLRFLAGNLRRPKPPRGHPREIPGG
ncbi:MAG: hypothetical protein M3463_15310, partial [Verrucomicrobiota bacterium]|nr:hypothetical protein [Verrucomicrobiota bacterium]